MCVRIAMDLGIFSTLSERNGPVTLEDLAATKGADLVLTGTVIPITSMSQAAKIFWEQKGCCVSLQGLDTLQNMMYGSTSPPR